MNLHNEMKRIIEATIVRLQGHMKVHPNLSSGDAMNDFNNLLVETDTAIIRVCKLNEID